jgi:hypothetical protein
MCNTWRTTENGETKSTLEGGSWKGCKNVSNKELVVYSYEQRRMEATFKRRQDTYRVVEPMMMMMMMTLRDITFFHFSGCMACHAPNPS